MSEESTLSEEMGISNQRAHELVEEWLLPDPQIRYKSPSDLLQTIAEADLTINEKLTLVVYAMRLAGRHSK